MDDRSGLPEPVLSQYDLGQIQAVEPKSGGWIDRSFIVSGERGWHFFKRRSPAYTPHMVACDHALIRFLVRHAFPTPALISTRSGDTWVEREGRVYEAYAYVEGVGFSPGDPRHMTSLGRTVGHYHRLVASYQPPRLKLPPWQDLSGYLDPGPYLAPRLAILLARGWIGEAEERWVREVRRQLRRRAELVRAETDLVYLTVHGALEPGNVLFDQEGEVVAWVDWADSAHFVRAYDVAHALLKFAGCRPDAILPGQVGPALPWATVERFALAYREEVRLTGAEGALLPWLMLACRVVDALWVDESLPINYRRELSLAQQLRTWLMENTDSLQELFC